MSQVKCDLCGSLVDARGLHAHRNSARCRVARTARVAREQDLERASHVSRPLAAAGIRIYDLATSYLAGGPRRRTKVYYSPYAPAWAVRAYSALRRARYTVDECVELLALGEDHPRLRAALALEVIAR